MKYEYFFSYAHARGFGNSYCVLDEEIDSIDELESTNKWLKKVNSHIEDIVILNFIKLREFEKD